MVMATKLHIQPDSDERVTIFESPDGKCGVTINKDGSAEVYCEDKPLELSAVEVNMMQGISQLAIKSTLPKGN